MLQLDIRKTEYFIDQTQEFIAVPAQTITLEHSLLSVSKWESKWHKPFYSDNDKSGEEMLDYIRCMTVTRNVDPNVYYTLTAADIDRVSAYISDSATATTINRGDKQKKGREIVTSELIYYWMIALNIPFECQKWHLNRLLTLIEICNIKNAPPKKIKKNELAARNRALNASRRKALGTRG